MVVLSVLLKEARQLDDAYAERGKVSESAAAMRLACAVLQRPETLSSKDMTAAEHAAAVAECKTAVGYVEPASEEEQLAHALTAWAYREEGQGRPMNATRARDLAKMVLPVTQGLPPLNAEEQRALDEMLGKAPTDADTSVRPRVERDHDATDKLAMLREMATAALDWHRPGGMRPNHPPELAGCPASALREILRIVGREAPAPPAVHGVSTAERAAWARYVNAAIDDRDAQIAEEHYQDGAEEGRARTKAALDAATDALRALCVDVDALLSAAEGQ